MSNPPQMDRRPTRRPEAPKESAYEQLEDRSAALERERQEGGPGTAQPPDATKPLLHPAYSETPKDQERPPAPRRRKKR